MSEWIDKSAFYHFGLLPEVCIHSPDRDQYSDSYVPQDSCNTCGGVDWIESTMMLTASESPIQLPPKKVHRCKKCNSVRIAYHLSVKEEDE